jgi:hypothetical protein
VSGRRKALIVASGEYDHEGLRQLLSPAADAEALATVLGDPQIGDFDVQVVHNETAHIIQARIEDLFSEGVPDDLLLCAPVMPRTEERLWRVVFCRAQHPPEPAWLHGHPSGLRPAVHAVEPVAPHRAVS